MVWSQFGARCPWPSPCLSQGHRSADSVATFNSVVGPSGGLSLAHDLRLHALNGAGGRANAPRLTPMPVLRYEQLLYGVAICLSGCALLGEVAAAGSGLLLMKSGPLGTHMAQQCSW